MRRGNKTQRQAAELRRKLFKEEKLRFDENGDPLPPKKKKSLKKDKFVTDDTILLNLATRITLTDAAKVLAPSAIFVVCQHAFLFLEILDLQSKDYWIIFSLCSPISIFFLIWGYVVVMNSKATRMLRQRETDFSLKVEKMKADHKEKKK